VHNPFHVLVDKWREVRVSRERFVDFRDAVEKAVGAPPPVDTS